MTVDFRKGPIDIEPLAINGQEVEQVEAFERTSTSSSTSLPPSLYRDFSYTTIKVDRISVCLRPPRYKTAPSPCSTQR
ncbi:hypothetical protein LDENG_00104620 [Lucifuga dentata]|nr:hypothetical protein LDENG_00104620 [Lucifuga dentata]